MRLISTFRVTNKQAVPRQGGLLILAHHRAYLDPIPIQLACLRPIHFMSKQDLFEMPTIGWILRWFRAFPVSRGGASVASLRHAIALLEAGECVCMFPEGGTNQTKRLAKIMPGAALIVKRSRATVIACGIVGTDLVMPGDARLPRLRPWTKVEVIWGKPTRFPGVTSNDEILQWVGDELAELSRIGAPPGVKKADSS